MLQTLEKQQTKLEIGDLVIINTGVLGKLAYRITNDFLHIKLTNIDNDFDYEEVFPSLYDLEQYIETSPLSISTVSLV